MLASPNKDFPRLPTTYDGLFDCFRTGFSEEKLFKYEQECDCCGESRELQYCPHMTDPSIEALLKSLPKRLYHLEAVNCESKADIRMQLYREVLINLQRLPCDCDTDDAEPSGSTSNSMSLALEQKAIPDQLSPKMIGKCHIFRDLQRMFPSEHLDLFKPPQDKKQTKLQNTIVTLSFCSNILLLVLKVVAMIISKSMSIIASLMDSAMDIVSGFVLFFAHKKAKKGVASGDYQRVIHNQTVDARHFYASRYESLGVLSFSCIMATLSLVLIYESIMKIIDFAKGQNGYVVFNTIPMVIVGFTIGLKLILALACYFCIKVKKVGGDIVTAYGEDHRNDVLTNSLGFAGAALTYYLGGQWKYCDPAVSIALAFYILVNWALRAIEQMRSLTGYLLDDKGMIDYAMRLMHQLPCSVFIRSIDSMFGMVSGQQAVLEFRLIVPETFSVSDAHNVCQSVQTAFERLPNVERCYVHIESDSCENVF